VVTGRQTSELSPWLLWRIRGEVRRSGTVAPVIKEIRAACGTAPPTSVVLEPDSIVALAVSSALSKTIVSRITVGAGSRQLGFRASESTGIAHRLIRLTGSSWHD
jgi:hypothetical protein